MQLNKTKQEKKQKQKKEAPNYQSKQDERN